MKPTIYLDLATVTGVCVGIPSSYVAYIEDFTPNKTKKNFEPPARRFTKFHNWLGANKIERVVVEKCYSRGKSDAPVLYGLHGILALCCDRYNIELEFVDPSTLKKYITGNGKAKKELMAEMLHKRFGITEFNNNIVDAISLMMYDHKVKGKKI